MNRRRFLQSAQLGAAGLALAARTPAAGAATPSRPGPGSGGVKTLLSFATEAAHAPEDPDFIRDLALFLTAENLVGNFHLTGDYARALKRHGRSDVVEALRRHEIGFHCNHHGSRPFMAGYLEKHSWEEGLARWLSSETAGLAVVAELFDRRPVYYTTEFSKAPQAIYGSTLLGAGIAGYVDVPMREHSAVWFCNGFVPTVENIVALESFHAPGDREKAARERLDQSVARQKAKGKDVLRVFLHSYKYYAEPPYDRLTMTREIYKNDQWYFEDYPLDYPRQAPARFRDSFAMLRRTLRHHARQSGFVTFSQYRNEFRANAGVWLDLPEVDRLGRFLARTLDAYVTPERSISPAEAFGVVVRVLRVWAETGSLPARVFVRNLIGPRAEVVEGGANLAGTWEEVRGLLPALDRELEITGALPVNVAVRGSVVGPGRLLRGLVGMYQGIRQGRPGGEVAFVGEDLPEIAQEAYFRETSMLRPGLYPDDFTGRRICAACRAQSWSWKPAVRVTPA